MTTGQRIKDRRLALGMTAEELGNKVGVAKSTIGRYEAGTIAKIPYLTFIRIMAALGATADELISKEEIEPIGTDGLEAMKVAFDEAAGNLRDKLGQMTPSELEKVDSFAQGLLAARPDEEHPSR